MSTPEKMPFATARESCAMGLYLLSSPLFFSLCELTRLSLDTYGAACSGAGSYWGNVLLARTPEQFVRRQADTWPWIALQIAGYTRGWMNIAAETAANLSKSACERQDQHARHLTTTLDGLTRYVRGLDAMLGAMNPVDPVSTQAHGVALTPPTGDSQDIARAVPLRAADAPPAAAKRRSSSPRRHQSSR